MFIVNIRPFQVPRSGQHFSLDGQTLLSIMKLVFIPRPCHFKVNVHFVIFTFSMILVFGYETNMPEVKEKDAIDIPPYFEKPQGCTAAHATLEMIALTLAIGTTVVPAIGTTFVPITPLIGMTVVRISSVIHTTGKFIFKC